MLYDEGLAALPLNVGPARFFFCCISSFGLQGRQDEKKNFFELLLIFYTSNWHLGSLTLAELY